MMFSAPNQQSSWQSSRRQGRKRWLWIAAVSVLLISGLLSLKAFNRLSRASGSSVPGQALPHDSLQTKGMEVWDGKKFVYSETENKNTEMTSEENYSFRLKEIQSSPMDEKNLILKIQMDLLFPSRELLPEIQSRQNDLRTLVNFVISSKNLDEIRVDSLRPLVLEQFNSFLKKGKVDDVRFIDFQVERIKSVSPKSRVSPASKPSVQKNESSHANH